MKNICVLGATGSIGLNTLEVVSLHPDKYNVFALSANTDWRKMLELCKLHEPAYAVMVDPNSAEHLNKLAPESVTVLSGEEALTKAAAHKQTDYVMSAVVGSAGMSSTLAAAEAGKRIMLANKESLVLAGNLLMNAVKKHGAELIPVDSEHFSIWSLINNVNKASIEEIILTASGGPFLNKSTKSLKNIKPKDAIKHPNWSMGKKISIDSTNLMNKVLEVIEAQRIFNIDKKKFKILIHPKSYIHAIIKFNNGLVKFLAHDTHMKIPIFNSIYFKKNKKIRSKQLNLKVLNNLELSKPNINQFPVLNILKMIPNKTSLFETILVSANDELVNCYLEGKIKYTDIYENLIKIIQMKAFKKYLFISPKNVDQISKLMKEVRLKCNDLCII